MEDEKPGKIYFKKATIQDIPILLSIENKVAGTKIYSPMTDEKEWKEEFKKKNALIYLIFRDGIIIGDVSYEKRNDYSAYISGLVVDPQFQGQGIGREAVRLVIEELKDANKIELVTHPENKNAIKLYQSFGFEIKSRKENYYGDGEPRIVMIKEK